MNNHAWYIRKPETEEIKGPFPAGQISQEVLLGRYQLDDEVSHDCEEWLCLRDVAELVPEIYSHDQNDPVFKQKLDAARRWADERRGVDPIELEEERRSPESYDVSEMRRLHELAMQAEKTPGKFSSLMVIGFAILAVAFIIFLAFQYSPEDTTKVNCEAEVVAGVNFNGCKLNGIILLRKELSGIQLLGAELQTARFSSSNLTNANMKYAQLHLASLNYTNLTNVNLVGANLRGADLSGANLKNADLSYANLTDAIIYEVNFENARLSKTIWTDGRICRENSIGSCN